MRKTLAEFLLDEMHRRDMSIREFARLVGVSHPTIVRAVNEKNDSTPSLEFLEKLAKATGQDLTTLVLIAVPDTGEPEPGALVLANYIRLLPPDAQKEAETYILGLLTRAGRNKRIQNKGALGSGKPGDEGN